MNTNELLLLAFIGSILTLLIAAFLFKAVFNISERSRNIRIQTRLLIEIAKASGVTEEIISGIKKSK